MIKRLLIFSFLLFGLNCFSQDTIKSQRFSLGIGPTLGAVGWGANTHLSYALSKKFNIKIRGLVNIGKEIFYNNGTEENTYAYDISASINYFLLGNTLPANKANMYIGLGLGYLYQKTKTIEFMPNLTGISIGQGLGTELSLGGSVKLGPGRIYMEGYFSLAFFGSYLSTQNLYSNYPNGSPYRPTPSNNSAPYAGILCLNVGYAIPF